jgi:hypothetical protein
MLKFRTYHKKVWFITGTNVEVAKPSEIGKRVKEYKNPSNSIAVIYSDTEKKFILFVGHEADYEACKIHIISLALKLDIKKIEVGQVERFRDFGKWDKFMILLQRMLDASNQKGKTNE